MNKFNRKNILVKTKFVHKLASQIKPFDFGAKEFNAWYTSHGMSLLEVSHVVKNMSVSLKLKLYISLKKSGHLEINPYGNCFYEKFIMFLFCTKHLHCYSALLENYNKYVESTFKESNPTVNTDDVVYNSSDFITTEHKVVKHLCNNHLDCFPIFK